MTHRMLALFAAVLLAAVLPAGATPAAEADPDRSADLASVTDAFEAEVRRTSHGIVHVKAVDYAGVGYGYGYALARDNLCVLADTYVTVNAQRSLYFGSDGQYRF